MQDLQVHKADGNQWMRSEMDFGLGHWFFDKQSLFFFTCM